MYGKATYGQSISNSYDNLYGDFAPSASQICALAEFAGDGLAVEAGSGTGRVTVPLARMGVRVIGVDAAPSMADVLREKARGLPVEAVCADAADYRASEPVALVFAVFNTFFLLAGESVQERFVGCAAEMLQPGGRLVLETFVPRPGRLPDGPNPGVLPEHSDVVVKRWVTEDIDELAAGHRLSLESRWADWERNRYRHDSPKHVSVYVR